MTNSILLLSGGIDSSVCVSLLLEAGKKPIGLFVNYGQAAAGCEKRAASSIAKHFNIPFKTIDIHLGHEFGVGEITGRNLLLISSALSSAQGHTGVIVIGIHAGVSYYDCSPDFAERARALVSKCTSGNATLITPLISWQKPEIIQYAIKNNVPLEITYSCERGQTTPCGECRSCKDRENLEC